MADKAVIEILASTATIAAIGVKSAYDAVSDRRRDRVHRNAQASLRDEMTAGFTRVDASVAELRAFVVGPDGENGLRGDVREIKARVIGLENRERERLSAHQVGSYQPPRPL